MVGDLLTFLFTTTVSRRSSGLVTQPSTEQISEDLLQEINRPERVTPHLELRIRIYGTLPAVHGYLLGSVLTSLDKLLTVQSVVFQTGFLGTLGFRKGVSGFLRNADESLGILCVVIINFSKLLL